MGTLKEQFLLRIIFPLAEKFVGTCASKWYWRIVDMNTWTPAQIQDWQNYQLSRFVAHAYYHTKYYRELFDSLNLTPEDIQCAADLVKLPVLTKDTLRCRYADFIPDDIDTIPHRVGHTGGTTGNPMEYLVDENVWGYCTAHKMISWKATGYHFGDKFIALGSASILQKKPSLVRRIYDKLRGEIALNSMNLDDDLCQKYVDRILNEHIQHIYGYATAIYLLASYVKRKQISLRIHAYTTSENLTPMYRRTIEDAFGYRVMDCYGARDAGMTSYEVTPGYFNIGHITIAEVVDTYAENTGTLVTTCFVNNCMPLMRYSYGDDATLTTNHDVYNGQVITQIQGRTSDVIRLKNGHNLTGPGFTILMLNFDVVAFEIRQLSDSSIMMRIQPKPQYDDTQEQQLMNELKRFAGDGCEVSIEKVDHFEELKNGKHRFFYNA